MLAMFATCPALLSTQAFCLPGVAVANTNPGWSEDPVTTNVKFVYCYIKLCRASSKRSWKVVNHSACLVHQELLCHTISELSAMVHACSSMLLLAPLQQPAAVPHQHRQTTTSAPCLQYTSQSYTAVTQLPATVGVCVLTLLPQRPVNVTAAYVLPPLVLP